MSHSEQKVNVTTSWGGRVGEQPERKEAEFVGEPRMPLTDEDVANARYDSLDKACRYISQEQGKYVRPSPDQGGPDVRGPRPPQPA